MKVRGIDIWQDAQHRLVGIEQQVEEQTVPFVEMVEVIEVMDITHLTYMVLIHHLEARV